MTYVVRYPALSTSIHVGGVSFCLPHLYRTPVFRNDAHAWNSRGDLVKDALDRESAQQPQIIPWAVGKRFEEQGSTAEVDMVRVGRLGACRGSKRHLQSRAAKVVSMNAYTGG